MIFYASPHRIQEDLCAMRVVFGKTRYVVIARELTKHFETVYGDTLDAVIQKIETIPQKRKGEFVILVEGDTSKQIALEVDQDALKTLKILLEELPLKQAIKLTSKITGRRKNELYDAAVKLS